MLPLSVYEIKIMGTSVLDEVTYKNHKMKARATLNAANTIIKTITPPAILPAVLGIPNKQ